MIFAHSFRSSFLVMGSFGKAIYLARKRAFPHALLYLSLVVPGVLRSQDLVSIQVRLSEIPSSATRLVLVADKIPEEDTAKGAEKEAPPPPLKVTRDIATRSQALTLALVLASKSAYRVRVILFKAGANQPIVSAAGCAITEVLRVPTLLQLPLQHLSPWLEPRRSETDLRSVLKMNLPGPTCFFDPGTPVALWLTEYANAPDTSGELEQAPLTAEADGHLAAVFRADSGDPGLRYQLGVHALSFRTEQEIPLFLWPQYFPDAEDIEANPGTGNVIPQMPGSYRVERDSTGKLQTVFIPSPANPKDPQR